LIDQIEPFNFSIENQSFGLHAEWIPG